MPKNKLLSWIHTMTTPRGTEDLWMPNVNTEEEAMRWITDREGEIQVLPSWRDPVYIVSIQGYRPVSGRSLVQAANMIIDRMNNEKDE
jgi:hypothetical protein